MEEDVAAHHAHVDVIDVPAAVLVVCRVHRVEEEPQPDALARVRAQVAAERGPRLGRARHLQELDPRRAVG